MGMTLMDFPIKISTRLTANSDNIAADFVDDVGPLLDEVRKRLKKPNLFWDIEIDMPPVVGRHTGLGTTTQIMGAVALCAAKTAGVEFSYADLFNLGIGYASALGLSLLFQPGFVIESGYKISDKESGGCRMYPDKYNVYQMPTGAVLSLSKVKWSLLLAIPKDAQSLSGKVEDEFWDKVLPDSLESTYRITYNVLEKIIPGLICDDYNEFLAGMQEATKNGTKPSEESIQNPRTKEVLDTLRKDYGFAAISSLGPTVYAFSDKVLSQEALKKLESNRGEFIFHAVNLNEARS